MFFRLIPKKNLKFFLIIFLGPLFFPGYTDISAGQSEIVEIETFLSKNGIHPGETFKIAILVRISPGWHIHAHELHDQFLIPTELIFEEDEKIKVTKTYYPEPKLEKFEYSESELEIYDGEVILGALIKVNELPLGKHHLKGELGFQACDDRSCLPPKKIEFEIPFEVVSLSKKTEEINQHIFSKLDFKKTKRSLQRLKK